MHYPIAVAGLKRDLPLFPISDELQIAAFIMLGDQELTVACASALLEKAPEYDYMLTAEAKGIPLIHEMARQAGAARYFVARKKMKLYMGEALEVDVQSITTAGMQKLFLTEDDAALMKGRRILIVDDVISTGKSLEALEKLVEKAGGIGRRPRRRSSPRAKPPSALTSPSLNPSRSSTRRAKPSEETDTCRSPASSARWTSKSRFFAA